MRIPFLSRGIPLALGLPFLFSPVARTAPPAAQVESVPEIASTTAERDQSGTITLKCETPGAVVRYSLDGSEPGPKAGPYLGPIALPAGGVVKARAFSMDRKHMGPLLVTTYPALPGVPPLPSTLIPCTQDRDWPVYDWAARHAAVSKITKERQSSLIFLGDSITQMFGGEPHDRTQAGSEVWERHYASRNAANLGFGYDFVENALWRVLHGELDGAAAKVIVVNIGTNNVSRNAPEEIAMGIRELCVLLHERQPAAAIVLMAIFPRGAKPDATRAKVDAVNHLISALDGHDGVKFLDIGPKFLEPDGSILPSIMPGYLHPGAEGYEIWAAALEPVLAQLLGEVKP